jgi:hypothetical protein
MTMDRDFLARLASPAHQRLYRHWCERSRDSRLPGRQDLDLSSLKDLAPWIGEIEVTRAQSRLQFRYRQAGKAIVKARRADPSGRPFEETHRGGDLVKLRVTLIQVVAKKQPVLTDVSETAPGGVTLEDERLILPLATDGELVDSLVFLADYSAAA